MDYADGNMSTVATIPLRLRNYGKAAFDHTHTLIFSYTWDLPRYSGSQSLLHGLQYFNTAAFGRPAKGDHGNAPKDVIRGPGLNNWDLSIQKHIPLGSDSRLLQIRGEFYNTWNHTQFSAVDTSALFKSADEQPIPRVIQLSMRAPQ